MFCGFRGFVLESSHKEFRVSGVGLQVVILFQILAAEMNFGYKFQTVRLEKFNDKSIRNLKHLAKSVDSCRCASWEKRVSASCGSSHRRVESVAPSVTLFRGNC